MKGKSLLFGLCLCLWTSLGWGQRVIECPVVRGDQHVYVRYCKNGADRRGD